MRVCTVCGAVSNRTEFSHCSACGKELENCINCSICGTELSPANNFCPGCGQKREILFQFEIAREEWSKKFFEQNNREGMSFLKGSIIVFVGFFTFVIFEDEIVLWFIRFIESLKTIF